MVRFCAYVVAASLVMLFAATASATSLIYEPFDYTLGADLGPSTLSSDTGQRNTQAGTTAGTAVQADTSVGNFWRRAAPNSGSPATNVPANSIDIANGSLTAPAEASTLKSAIGNSLSILDGTNSGAADRLAFRADAGTGSNVTSGSIFYSFLLNVGSLTGSNNVAGDYFITLNNTANAATTANPSVVPGQMRIRIDPNDASKYDIGMFTQRTPTQADAGWSNNTTDATPMSLITGQTYFVVGKFNIGASNSTQLWINPDQSFFGGPTAAPITAHDSTSGSNGTTIGSLLIHQRNTNPDITIDELRVGTLWSEVTPLGTPTLYWDIDAAGTTAGAGGATPSGTWDGSLTNWNNRSDGGNGTSGDKLAWSDGGVAVFSAGTDATGAYTITVSGTRSTAGLTFEDGTATLTGGTVSLTGLHTVSVNTGVTANVGSAIGGTVGMVKEGAGTLVLTGNQTYSGATSINGGTLQLGSGATGGTTGTLPTGSAISVTGTFAINRSNAVAQGTDFSGAAITGTGGFTNAGSGTTTLNAANTFSGTTRLGTNAGTLAITHSLALQNTTLDMNSGDNGSLSVDSSLSAVSLGAVSGSRNLSLLNSASGALAVTLGGGNNNATYSGVLSGAGSSLTKVGTGVQTLSGANTYSGSTNVNAGTLQFAKLVAMPNATAAVGDYNGNGTTETSDDVLWRKNPGAFGGDPAGYNVWRGDYGNSSQGLVTVNNGGTLAVNAGGTGEWSDLTSGAGSIGGLIAGTGGQGAANQVTWMPGSALGIDTTNAPGPPPALTYNGVVGNFRTAGGGTTNAVGFTKRGVGLLTLTGNNTFSGPLTVTGGTADTDDSTRSRLVLTGTNLNAGTNTALPTVTIGSFSRLELGASNILPSGSLINTTGAQAKLVLHDVSNTTGYTQTVRSIVGTNGVMDVGVGKLIINDQPGDVYQYGIATGAFISTSESNTGGFFDENKGVVDKIGTGTLILEGDAGNNFDGTFIMEAGTLKMSRNQVFATNSDTGRLIVKGGQLARSDTPSSNFTYSVAFLDLHVLRYDLSDDSARTSQFGSGTITTLKENDVEINITNTPVNASANDGRFILPGDIKNHDATGFTNDDTNAVRGITKTGNGVLSISGTTTYKGSTTVQDGVLLMSATSTLGDTTQATAIIKLKGGILATTATRTTPIANPVVVDSSAGTATVAHFSTTPSLASVVMEFNNNLTGTSGSLTIRNMNTGTGNTVFRPLFTYDGINFGLPITISDTTGTGSNMKSNELQFGNSTGTQTFSGVLSGGGSVRRVNAGGTTILSGNNTYSGTTIIDAGTLLLNGANTGGGAVTINAGGTLGGTGSTTSAVTLNSSGTLAPGASIQSLDVGSLAVSGGLLSFELNAPGSPGVNSDLLNVTANNGLTITSGTVDLINAGGLAAGTYTLIDYAGAAIGDATVDLLTLGAQPAGFTYDLVDNGGNTSVDLVVTAAGSGAIAAVPEPSGLVLILLSIGPALLRRQRAVRS
jgi:fibronectin-binding autotransporter adhesin